jgi:hypothetical protein
MDFSIWNTTTTVTSRTAWQIICVLRGPLTPTALEAWHSQYEDALTISASSRLLSPPPKMAIVDGPTTVDNLLFAKSKAHLRCVSPNISNRPQIEHELFYFILF